MLGLRIRHWGFRCLRFGLNPIRSTIPQDEEWVLFGLREVYGGLRKVSIVVPFLGLPFGILQY